VRAVQLRAFQHPIELTEVAMPGDLGPRDILIEVASSGVCHKDVLIVEGFQPRVGLPRTLGHEVAGRVQAVGSQVSDLRPGDRVCSLGYVSCRTCPACVAGNEHLCRNRLWLGEEIDGGYAQYVRVAADSVATIPDNVSDDDAALATCVLGTIVHGLGRLGQLKAGQTVLITGAAGAVGSNAVLIAKAMGAKVIATDIPDKVERIAGADVALPFGDDLAARIKKATGGGADVVVEAVGTPTIDQSLRAVNWGGRIIVIGNVRPGETLPLPLGTIIMREVSIHGSMNATRADLVDALRLLADGGLKPAPATVLPLAEAQHAHDLLRQKRSVGKIVLKP